MFERSKRFAGQVAHNLRHSKTVQSVGLLVGGISPAFAADWDGTVDTTQMLLYIAGGLTAAIALSIAMTGAQVGVKASKLPRRGA